MLMGIPDAPALILDWEGAPDAEVEVEETVLSAGLPVSRSCQSGSPVALQELTKTGLRSCNQYSSMIYTVHKKRHTRYIVINNGLVGHVGVYNALLASFESVNDFGVGAYTFIIGPAIWILRRALSSDIVRNNIMYPFMAYLDE